MVQRGALCRTRRELSNAYLLAEIGFDTAENEPGYGYRISNLPVLLILSPGFVCVRRRGFWVDVETPRQGQGILVEVGPAALLHRDVAFAVALVRAADKWIVIALQVADVADVLGVNAEAMADVRGWLHQGKLKCRIQPDFFQEGRPSPRYPSREDQIEVESRKRCTFIETF